MVPDSSLVPAVLVPEVPVVLVPLQRAASGTAVSNQQSFSGGSYEVCDLFSCFGAHYARGVDRRAHTRRNERSTDSFTTDARDNARVVTVSEATARVRAIRLYEELIRLAPDARDAEYARRRIIQIRANTTASQDVYSCVIP